MSTHARPGERQEGMVWAPDPSGGVTVMRTSHMLIQPLHLQQQYKDLSHELVHNNLIIRYFRFLESILTYMNI